MCPVCGGHCSPAVSGLKNKLMDLNFFFKVILASHFQTLSRGSWRQSRPSTESVWSRSSVSSRFVPSRMSPVPLCSATAGSLCQSDPGPAGWPAPSPRPAGPGTRRGFSLRQPAPQTVDKAPLGRSTASWPHICGTEGLIFQNGNLSI